MLKRLGAVGIVGVLALLGGLALIAVIEPIIAAGIALMLLGTGLIVRSLVSSLMGAMGMGGGMF